MDAALNLDRFYDWVCEMNDDVREMEQTMRRVHAWGVASTAFQTKLDKIQGDLHKLRLDVANCIANREVNRKGFIAVNDESSGGSGTSSMAVDAAPRMTNVLPFVRIHSQHRTGKQLFRREHFSRP